MIRAAKAATASSSVNAMVVHHAGNSPAWTSQTDAMGEIIHTPRGRSTIVTSELALSGSTVGELEGVGPSKRLFDIPRMKHVITDTHWSQRDRLGRSPSFLARALVEQGRLGARLIACDQGTAVVVDADGTARVYGRGAAHFLAPYVMVERFEKTAPFIRRGCLSSRFPGP